MWPSQQFVPVLANTDYTTSTSMLAFDKPLPATPFTESGTDDTIDLPAHLDSTLPLDQEPLVIAVVGHGLIGLSKLIQLGFPHYPSYHYKDTMTGGAITGIRQHSYVVNINKGSSPRHVIFLEMDHILKDDDLTTSVHAALICYDVTQRLSMTSVPDLLSFYHSQQLPSYLLGLNSDSTSTPQVDYTLGKQLAQHYRVEFYEMNTNDALTIHHMFMNLLRKCVSAPINNNNNNNNKRTNPSPVICQPSTPPSPPPPSSAPPPTNIDDDDDTNNIKMASSTTMAEVVNQQHPVENNYHHDNNQVRHLQPLDNGMTATISTSELNADLTSDDPSSSNNNNHAGCPSVGFVYAPTTLSDDIPTFLQNLPLDPLHDKLLSTSTDNFPKLRRGSKDSGDSLGTGLSVDAIIDRLITPGIGRSDDLMIPIFVIFFRKFMSPYELIRVLIQRFENDLCMPSLPTPLQQRICSVLITWMTDYWCDFYHRQTRNQIHLFLGRLSAMVLSTTTTIASSSSPSLQSLLEKLYPLSLQPTPDFDPDSTWGRKDMDGGVTIDHSKKKDSGYISSYLGASYTSLVPESSTSDIGDCIWSRRPSATATPPAPPSSSPPPPLQHHPSTMTNPAKLCTSSSLLNSPTTTTTPDYFNNSSSSTSRMPSHMIPSLTTSPSSSSPSPPTTTTSSESTTPASFINIKSNDYRTTTNSKRTTATTTIISPSPSPTSSSSNASLTRPEFAGGIIHIISPTSIPCQPMTTSCSNCLGIPMASSLLSPSIHPYYPTGLTSPQPSSMDTYESQVPPSGFMHQQQQSTTYISSAAQNKPSIPMNDPTAIKINTKLLLSLSSQEMAGQLTWIEAELFGKIKSREFIRMIWSTSNKRQQTRPNSMASLSSEEQEDLHFMDSATTRTKSGLLASISHFNFISAWVISMIVTQPKLTKRVALLEKFMTIAVALRDLNNYNSLMAILAGVNNAAILRMKNTQEAIKKKKIYKRFQSLEKLMGSDRSYSSYRIALKASTSYPSIPYLGIHSQDLIALDEANKDVKTDGTIHWDKFRLMGECIMMIIKLQQQQPKHDMIPNQTILNWIGNCSILTEEEQYTQSVLIEPRLKTKSLTRLRDLWFRT